MKRADIISSITISCVTAVVSFVVLIGANWAAGIYLRHHPQMLMTQAERVNENMRSVREAMIPRDKITAWYDLEKPEDLKPMWDELFATHVEFESYVHFRAKPFEGRFAGATEGGYRRVRDQGPWPTAPENYNVFFFGGSTAYGVGPYWATVASYLQQALNADAANTTHRPIKVYNFGRSGYFTGQEVVLFQRLLTLGHVPDMAIFLDGPNDFCWVDGQPSSWQMLAEHFNSVNEESRRHSAGEDLGTQWGHARQFLTTLPITRVIGALTARASGPGDPKYVAQGATVEDEKPAPKEQLEAVMDRYVSIKRQIEGMSAAFGITPVFGWQPIPTYKYDLSYHLFNPSRLNCHVNSKVGYPMMDARVKASGGLGPDFIWLANMQETAREPLYVDAFHYTAPMSRRVAEVLAREIEQRGLFGSAPPTATGANAAPTTITPGERSPL